MKSCCGMILCLMMPLACPAAEIVAWKVPLSRYIGEGLQSQGVVRRAAPPEVSPFFKDGNELWDLKGAKPYMPDNQELSLDWMVWDATSERLVAKGNWADICAVHEILRIDELPRQYRLTVDLYEVAADGAPLAENSTPVSELSLRGRSGQKSTASWSGNGKSITVETEAIISDEDTIIDARLIVSAEVPGQIRMTVDTAFSVKAGTSLWVARDFDGKKGLDLKATYLAESMDGTPLRELVMIQKGEIDRSLSAQRTRDEEDIRRIDKEGWWVNGPLSPEALMQFLAPQPSKPGADPLSEAFPAERVVLPRVSSVMPPPFLKPWLDHEVLDATGWLGKILPDMNSQGSFTGYDPIEQRLYFYSNKQETAEMVSSMFGSRYCGGGATGVVVTLDGPGQTRLMTKAGQKASLSRIVGEKTELRSLEIEPTIAENGDLIDLRAFFEDTTDPMRLTRLNSANTLSVGKPLELLSGVEPDGRKRSLRMKAEVFRILLKGGE